MMFVNVYFRDATVLLAACMSDLSQKPALINSIQQFIRTQVVPNNTIHIHTHTHTHTKNYRLQVQRIWKHLQVNGTPKSCIHFLQSNTTYQWGKNYSVHTEYINTSISFETGEYTNGQSGCVIQRITETHFPFHFHRFCQNHHLAMEQEKNLIISTCDIVPK